MCKSKKLSLPNKNSKWGVRPLIQPKRIIIQSTARHTFNKRERLSSKKRIDVLFKEGKHHQAHPIKMVQLLSNTKLEFAVQAMFVVPKRMFKKAHDRNKIRRRMKEVYRLNKNEVYKTLQEKNETKIVAFIFTGKEIASFNLIQTAMLKLMANLLR